MQIFSTLRELRFGDCDISGTAYFPAYLKILNGVNEEFWAHLGYPWHDVIAKERWGTPTVHLSCDFSKPSFFGETLKFELVVTRVGRASLILRHKISVADETRWTCTQVLASSDLDSLIRQNHGMTLWKACWKHGKLMRMNCRSEILFGWFCENDFATYPKFPWIKLDTN